jgi:hypothetical protein
MRRFSCILFIVLLTVSLNAQDKTAITAPRFRLGIEAGADALFGNSSKPEMIRESKSYYFDYDYDYNCGFVFAVKSYGTYYLGLKPEYSINSHLAVATGLRFSYHKGYINSDRDYFIWKISENETNTNYVKIRNISQRNFYLGIPLEVRLFTGKRDYNVRHYFVLGTSLNLLVASNVDISFQNSNMEKYSPLIREPLGKPTKFSGFGYLGMGLKIGKSHRPFGHVEVHFPVCMIENGSIDSLSEDLPVGIGIQTTLQIPFKKYK